MQPTYVGYDSGCCRGGGPEERNEQPGMMGTNLGFRNSGWHTDWEKKERESEREIRPTCSPMHTPTHATRNFVDALTLFQRGDWSYELQLPLAKVNRNQFHSYLNPIFEHSFQF